MIIEKLKKSMARTSNDESGRLFKGMLTLLLGAGAARILGLLFIPILARIYSPEDFGVLALYTSLVTVLSPTLTLRYVQAIPLPKTDVMAFNLFFLCLKLILFGTLVIAIVFFFLGEIILSWFNMQVLVSWWWLIVLGIAGTAFYELFSLWATRQKKFKVIAKTQIRQSFVGNITKVALGLLALKPIGLVIGQFLSQSAGITSFIKESLADFKRLFSSKDRKKEHFLAKYYQDFVWYRLPSQFLMLSSVQAPVLMMAALYDKEVTGQLSLALMALSLPVNLIGSAMAKAYYAEVAEIGKKDRAKIRRITFAVQKKLFAVGTPVMIGGMIFVKPIFELVFGEAWSVAGQYAVFLAPFMLLQFTSSPLVQVINVVSKQLTFLIINVLRFLGLGLVGLAAIFFDLSANNFVVLLSIYLLFFYFIMTLFINLMLGKGVSVVQDN